MYCSPSPAVLDTLSAESYYNVNPMLYDLILGAKVTRDDQSTENLDIDYTQPSSLSFMGRTGSDRENANLIFFLAGEEAGYISGQNIQIDGCRKKQ